MAQAAGEDEILLVYRASIDGLYAFVASRCGGDRDLAEDIVQESWLRAVRSWCADGLPDNPQAWLTTVAKNLLANHYRRQPAESLDPHGAGLIAPDEARSVERDSLVARALARLAVPYSRLLHAFHFDRVPVASIAAEYGISERAVEGRLRRARQQLRHQIESDPDHEGDSR